MVLYLFNLLELDQTDCVPFRHPNAINISDIVTDESSSPRLSSASKGAKVSFEPSEMTWRSILSNNIKKNHKNTVKRSGGPVRDDVNQTKNISVSEILPSSFSQKARNHCEFLHDGDTIMDSGEDMSIPSASTSFSSSNSSRSLPQLADMFLSNNTCSEESFIGGFGSFSINSVDGDHGLSESDNFPPEELMQLKPINDEISSAQEYADKPSAALSEPAKAKELQNSSYSNSVIVGDPNFSVGYFSNMGSKNMRNIVQPKSPDKWRTPVALVDKDDNTVTSTSSDIQGDSVTPKVDNKTYTDIRTLKTGKKMPLTKPRAILNYESKDSGNSTDNSYLLSISAIDRALCNLDIQSDDSGFELPEQLLMHGKNSKSHMNPYYCENNRATLFSKKKSVGADINLNGNEKIISIEEMILENKENLDPKNKRNSVASALCDTMTFSDSLLSSSDMKNLNRSNSQSRMPLRPNDVSAPNIQITRIPDYGEDADDDEWPGTPIAHKRRVRRTKSLRDNSPLQTNNPENDSLEEIISVNSRRSTGYTLIKNKRTSEERKSMNSTRIGGDDGNSNGHCAFGNLQHITNSHSSSSLAQRNNTLRVPKLKSPRTSSPLRLDNSPKTNTLESQSPNLDAISNSNRLLLNAGAAGRVVSSPVGSESPSNYSCGTMPTYRSAISGASSEFTHRDGKKIPLKVTNTELSWGSVKLRSTVKKCMQIKNIINKRLVIRIEASGPGFQIVNNQQSNTIILHSLECRTISISFCPTVRGVAIGKLSFYGPKISNSLLDVPLYGYGGDAIIKALNVSNGPVGYPFLTMGFVRELTKPLERTVSFYNNGSLLGFVSVTFYSNGLLIPRLSDDAFEIHPSRILIPPKTEVQVRIVFRPKREDIKKIINKIDRVMTLATLQVISGDEANRQRNRRLISQMTEKERSKVTSPILDRLWTKFPQESEMTDLYDIKENSTVAMELVSYFRIHEILLTIKHENNGDTFESSSMFLAEMDETIMFRTVCAAADSPTPTSNLSTVDEIDKDVDAKRVTKSNKQGFWSVSPQTLDINLNKQQVPLILCVRNGFKSRKFFEVACNLKDMLLFTPTIGYVAPDGGQTEINVRLHANFQCPSANIYVMVYMENEGIMVPVNIKK